MTAYRIFIASPGGLEDEREDFKEVLQAYNEQDAIERGVIFIPVGWEITPGGVGRPQKLINDDVRRCDYFLMLLWDRWGSPPQAGDAGPYTSGSHEEYGVASECYGDGSMREIVVLFKDVDPGKLSDPGKELTNVLEFRKRLEQEKSLLFETFDDPGAFREKLRRHLARWVRDHEEGGPDPEARPRGSSTEIPVESATEADQSESADVRNAEQLAAQGQLTEAEQKWAEVLPEADLDTLNRYGAFQIERGALASAEEAFLRMCQLARERKSDQWLIAGLTNLAGVYQAQGKLESAETNYKEALQLREKTLGPDHPEVAQSLNALAEVYKAMRRFDEAEPLYLRALQIQGLDVGQ
jgi:Tfp pilus assembly protein PilF